MKSKLYIENLLKLFEEKEKKKKYAPWEVSLGK